MSIAVSAVIKPSKLLLTTFGSLCLGLVLIAHLIVLNQMRDIAVGQQSLFAVVSLLLALFLFYYVLGKQKIVCLDISGVGQIRLSYQSDREVTSNGLTIHREGELMCLQPGSTIWARMLLLRLKNDIGQTKVLIVLSDSLAGRDFRSLSVACRWIAAHNNLNDRKIV